LAILIGLLIALVYQDFKSRAISWFLIPLLFIGFVIKGVLSLEFEELATYFGINLLIVLLNLTGVIALVSIKEKKLTNIVDTHLGLGDILFFLVLTVVFSPINFVVFFIGSILLITSLYGVVIALKKDSKFPIPLAGAMSLLLIVCLLGDQFCFFFNAYQDVELVNNILLKLTH